MAASPAQGQEDVAAPTRPAVGRRSLDDLPPDPRRPHAVARHRDQARPRPARAARRRRHAAVPRPGRLRGDEPDRPRRVRAPRRRAASASRRSARSWSTTSPSGCAASAARSSRPSPRPSGTERPTRSHARVAPAAPGRPIGQPDGMLDAGRRRPIGSVRPGPRSVATRDRAATEHSPRARPGPPSTSGSRGQRTPASGAPAFAIPSTVRSAQRRRPSRSGRAQPRTGRPDLERPGRRRRRPSVANAAGPPASASSAGPPHGAPIAVSKRASQTITRVAGRRLSATIRTPVASQRVAYRVGRLEVGQASGARIGSLGAVAAWIRAAACAAAGKPPSGAAAGG